MVRFGVTRPYLVLILFLAGILVVGFSIPKLHFSHNQLNYFTEDSDFMRQVRLIEEQTGGFRALELLIDTQREYAASLFDTGINVVVTGVVSINAVIINAMMTSLAIGYSMGFMLITALMILAIGDVRLGLLAMIPNLLPIINALGRPEPGLLGSFLRE